MKIPPFVDKPKKLVIVEWVDSHGSEGWKWWSEAEDHNQLMWCRSVGWIVSENKDAIVLAASISAERNKNLRVGVRGDISIPRCSIHRITIIRYPKNQH